MSEKLDANTSGDNEEIGFEIRDRLLITCATIGGTIALFSQVHIFFHTVRLVRKRCGPRYPRNGISWYGRAVEDVKLCFRRDWQTKLQLLENSGETFESNYYIAMSAVSCTGILLCFMIQVLFWDGNIFFLPLNIIELMLPYFIHFVIYSRSHLHRLQSQKQLAIKLEAETIYQDFSYPFVRAFLIGTAQLILIFVYMWGVGDGDTVDFKGESPNLQDPLICVYYFLGLAVNICYFFGSGRWELLLRQPKFWSSAYVCTIADSQRLWTCNNKSSPFKLNRRSFWLRLVWDVMINGIIAGMILGLVPIQVASAGNPLEFVLDVVAAYLIVELDDISEKVEFTAILAGKSLQQKKITDFWLPIQKHNS